MGNARLARVLIEELSGRIRESEKYLGHSDPNISNCHRKQIEENRERIVHNRRA